MKNIGTIYYLIPNIKGKGFSLKRFFRSISNKKLILYLKTIIFRKNVPIGGIKVAYQHCIMLQQCGYKAYPLLMGDYVGDFFGFDIENKIISNIGFNLEANDVVVSSEIRPYDGLKFNGGIKVLFMQNIGLTNRLREEDKQKSYIELGFDHVITCSQFCTEYLKNNMGIDAVTITNGVDQEKFVSKNNITIEGRILALPRKNKQDLENILQLLKGKDISFKLVDGLTQNELIHEYQLADIFLATGYPEGFGLPPLEAMLCGCAVVGFTGGGASEFMIDNETALVAEDGNCEAAANKILMLLNNKDLKERIRVSGMDRAKLYSLSEMKKKINNFYDSI